MTIICVVKCVQQSDKHFQYDSSIAPARSTSKQAAESITVLQFMYNAYRKLVNVVK